MKRRFMLSSAALCLLIILVAGWPAATPAAGPPAAPHAVRLDSSIARPPAARAGRWSPRTPISFILDDGSQEAVFGLNANYHGLPVLAVNRFTPNPADFPFYLTEISIQFPDPTAAVHDLTGRAIDLLIYADPSGSGNPANASKVYQQSFTIQVADGVSFSTYPLALQLAGPGDVYIGFSNTYDRGNLQPYTYPVPIDRNSSQQRSWIAANVDGSDPDYNDLANNAILSLIDNIGFYLAGNFVVRATGQTGPYVSPTPAAATPTATPTPAATPTRGILHDQYDNQGINATNSQNYEPTMTPYDDWLADDFIVPAGQTWTVDEVDVAGRIDNGNGPVETFNVIFSTDAGVPGTPLFTLNSLAYTHPGPNEYDIALPTPAVLPPGTYWVTVQANLTYWTGGGQFMWFNRTAQYNAGAAWWNPGDGWGTTCVENYGRRWQCTGDAGAPDQVFRLLGTGSAPSATTTPVAPPPTATATPTGVSTAVPTTTRGPLATNTPVAASSTPTATATLGGPTATAAPPTGTPIGPPTVPPSPTPSALPSPTACPVQFTDVDSQNPFYMFVQCLACRGIVGGYGDGTYRPAAPVTRGQMAKFIANAAGYAGAIPATQQTFVDVPPTHPFWVFVERVAAHGVVSGYNCGGAGEPCPGLYFRPANPVTRGQTAKFVAGAAGYADVIPSTQQTFADVPGSSPFWVFVERAYGHGVISGYSCGGAGEPCPGLYFRAGAGVTRGQTAKFIANAFFPSCAAP